MTSPNKFFTLLCTFLAVLVVPLVADDEQYKLSDDRIDTINRIIARAVADKEDLSDDAIIQAIYDRIAAEMPLIPQEPIIQVDLKKLNDEARAKALEKYKTSPVKLKNKVVAEAKKKYPMDQLRDKVTVVYKRGSVTGILYRINANNILVNNTTISFVDMDNQTRSRFDAQYNQKLQDQYIQERLNQYSFEFSRYQQTVFESLLAEANGENEKNGYIFLKRREIWKTAKEIASAELTVEIDRYKKMKAKQERIRRKREARELAAREAKEKAEAEARAAQGTDNPEGGENPDQQSQENPFALPGSEGEALAGDPQDILNSDNTSGMPQLDEGGTFIALTPEQLAALSRPKVNENDYKALMIKIEQMQNEINSKYFGIDADQGFKKALWGFRETDVYYALSKEPDAAFIKKLRINRNDILYPEGSRPQKIYLFYHLGELYAVDIFMGDLKPSEFNIYKNSLQQKYGKSDTQKKMGDDVFLRLAEGSLSPADMPKYVEASPDETGMELNEEETPRVEAQPAENPEQNNNGEGENAPPPEGGGEEQQAAPEDHNNGLFFFVWEGILSRGVLSFHYNSETKMYEDVVFEKMYLPLRLKKYEQGHAAASQPKASEEPAAPAAE